MNADISVWRQPPRLGTNRICVHLRSSAVPFSCLPQTLSTAGGSLGLGARSKFHAAAMLGGLVTLAGGSARPSLVSIAVYAIMTSVTPLDRIAPAAVPRKRG